MVLGAHRHYCPWLLSPGWGLVLTRTGSTCVQSRVYQPLWISGTFLWVSLGSPTFGGCLCPCQPLLVCVRFFSPQLCARTSGCSPAPGTFMWWAAVGRTLKQAGISLFSLPILEPGFFVWVFFLYWFLHSLSHQSVAWGLFKWWGIGISLGQDGCSGLNLPGWVLGLCWSVLSWCPKAWNFLRDSAVLS